MARNKYPEETVARILDVAFELFMRKGYEQTSIQDIVDGLDGLTKGAIYHHFKSKEEILDAAMERAMAPTMAQLQLDRDDAGATGAERLNRMFSASVVGPQLEFWKRAAPDADPVKNARLLGMQYAGALGPVVDEFLLPIIRDGLRDGSFTCENPRETAEILSLLANLWLIPLFHEQGTRDDLRRRLDALATVSAALGAPMDRARMHETADQLSDLLFD